MRADDAVAQIPAPPVPTGQTLPVAGGVPVLPSDRQAFRVGYGDQMMTTIDNRTPTTNATLPFRTPRNQAMMGAMADDPDLWRRRLDREIQMAQTRAAATGGSMTADNLADQADVVQQLGILSRLFAGDMSGAASQVGRLVVNAGSGLDEQTRGILARALLSSDPERELGRLFRAADEQARRSGAAQALIRFGGLPGGVPLLGGQP